MSSNIATRINDSLSGVWNTDDPLYLSVICDKNGSVPSTINKPTDIDIGAIASEIEWLRLLSIDLAKQIFLDQADTEFVKFILDYFFNIPRRIGESDEAWRIRAINYILQPKVSRAAIIYALRPYSSVEPQVTSSRLDAMFADQSFASRYKSNGQILNGSNFAVMPSYAYNSNESGFALTITLYDTLETDILTVVSLINDIIAAGIIFTLRVKPELE